MTVRVEIALVGTFPNQPAAQVAQAILEANGIPSIVSSDGSSAMEPQLNFVQGVRLLVRAEDLEDATALLELAEGETAEHEVQYTHAIVVREPEPADADAVSSLLAQLGYPAPAADVPGRAARVSAFDGAMVRVGELDGCVVGVVTAHVFPVIHAAAPAAWLTALVVDESARGAGVGGALVREVEAWALAHGATKLSLTSGTQRTDAHDFYKRRGYVQSGVRLTKQLPPRD